MYGLKTVAWKNICRKNQIRNIWEVKMTEKLTTEIYHLNQSLLVY